jgi:hypothetical protein
MSVTSGVSEVTIMTILDDMGEDSSTGYGLDNWGLIPGRDKRVISSPVSTRARSPTQPPIQWVPGTKRLRCAADHSAPFTEEVKNGAAIPPMPHMSSRCAA